MRDSIMGRPSLESPRTRRKSTCTFRKHKPFRLVATTVTSHLPSVIRSVVECSLAISHFVACSSQSKHPVSLCPPLTSPYPSHTLLQRDYQETFFEKLSAGGGGATEPPPSAGVYSPTRVHNAGGSSVNSTASTPTRLTSASPHDARSVPSNQTYVV